MRKNVMEFIHRGLVACGFVPLILVILYLIMQHQGILQVLTVNEVCLSIISLSLLAFIAGGMNVIYQVEQIPLMLAVLIHGGVLYVSYLATYLVNDWLEWGTMPVMVFTAIFVLGYLAVWAVIYCTTRKKTAQLNEMLKKKQQANDIE
ncbi:MAG: DUF3021 domain-containing protein [Clostridia bacterium]|nr:DUF3021 domain-containing protein [Clostridia bacterium]MBR5266195.1 DUF3021 domain-containing protein [Clostridia bacterium]